jgi:hypothetical protein
MKLLTGLFALMLSMSSFANSGETKTFVYDGSQNSIELILRGEKTHTEYLIEERRTTCFRTEIVGYRTICTGGYPGPYPHPGPYPRGPYPGPGRSCWQEPVYRQVAYPCIETVRVPYQVKDFDVEARVIVDVTKLSNEMTPGETFRVTLNGDLLTLNVIGSKKFFIVSKKQNVRTSVSGSFKFMDALYAVELVEAAPVLNALKMTKISIENSVLKFDLGPVASRAHLGFSLNIAKKKTLGSDTVIFDRELMASEVEIAANGERSEVGVNVDQLGVKLSGGKFSLTAKAFFKPAGRLLNSSQFGDVLEVSRTLIYTLR